MRDRKLSYLAREQLEWQRGNKTKRIRCERGKELLNEELKSFLQSNGMQDETSAPYTRQQNGNAERYK